MRSCFGGVFCFWIVLLLLFVVDVFGGSCLVLLLFGLVLLSYADFLTHFNISFTEE